MTVLGGLEPEDPRLIGPYRLVGLLGRGGMGRVFLGLSAGGRPVAVKVIRAELATDQEFRIRFSREVAAARRVSGLFTAVVVDADVDGPDPWLATAYVPGPSLTETVTRDAPMTARPLVALAAGLAESLVAIHAASVVHCDLKPSNVLLSADGPRVIDFGIARAAGSAAVTAPGFVVGSPGFMSPEQAMGEEPEPPSDVFSLGAVLTFAATSQGPFGQGSQPEVAYRLVYQPPELGGLPPELRPLVERCLAKEPGQRPTASEVLSQVADLQVKMGWLPGVPLAAYDAPVPPGTNRAGRLPLARLPLPRGGSGPVRRAAPVPVTRATPVAVPVPVPVLPAATPGPSASSRWWRPLTTGAAAAAVIGLAVGLSFARTGGEQPHSAAHAQRVSQTATASPGRGPAGAAAQSVPAASPSVGASPEVNILPKVSTRTSSAPSPAHSPSPRPSPPKPSRSPTPTPTPSPSGSGTASPTPTPTPSPSTSSSPSVSPSSVSTGPQVVSILTYRNGIWV